MNSKVFLPINLSSMGSDFLIEERLQSTLGSFIGEELDPVHTVIAIRSAYDMCVFGRPLEPSLSSGSFAYEQSPRKSSGVSDEYHDLALEESALATSNSVILNLDLDACSEDFAIDREYPPSFASDGPPQLASPSRLAHTPTRQQASPTLRNGSPRPDTPGSQNGLSKEVEFFKTSLCSFHSRGHPCPKGSACTYAHGISELRTFKTVMCREFVSSGNCARGAVCTFAHGAHELRSKSGLGETIDRMVVRNHRASFAPAVEAMKNMSPESQSALHSVMRGILRAHGQQMPVAQLTARLIAALPNEAKFLTDEIVLLLSILGSGTFLTNFRDYSISLVEFNAQAPKRALSAGGIYTPTQNPSMNSGMFPKTSRTSLSPQHLTKVRASE